MVEEHQFPPFPSSALRARWLKKSLTLWIALSLIGAFYLAPTIATARPAYFLTPTAGWMPFLMVLPAATIGLLAAIYSLSSLPNRVLFQPTRCRVLTTLFLWPLLPAYAVLGFVLPAFWVAIGAVFNGIDAETALATIFAALLLPMTYIVSCLFCSAFPNSKRRAFLLVMYWFACLSTMIALGLAQTEI
ncbi:hypothetical protein RXV86_18140 [Alisedimentitalea sp. MJ-SS2]|uniref:hypothetical protein n=1 Tax=Aliisedimentitalea sp. MJ-SS2 TaxID=3049795 RepID=UPI0029118599|nr:hypothetical protein [Alisedimentitalea sp. MJ-SS2]MDU8929317.1 hypothetical protein [Alisedimentitalea sp. MJ-SS2]